MFKGYFLRNYRFQFLPSSSDSKSLHQRSTFGGDTGGEWHFFNFVPWIEILLVTKIFKILSILSYLYDHAPASP